MSIHLFTLELNAFTGLCIHLVYPLIVLFILKKMVIQLKQLNPIEPPFIALYLVFFNYGSLGLVILTHLFWDWSGMASLGFFYLIYVAPIFMFLMGCYYLEKRTYSKFHRFICTASFLFIPIIGIQFFMILTAR